MSDHFTADRNDFEFLDQLAIKKINDQNLITKVNKTSKFLKLCEIYLHDVKGDYGKQKIASLRVEFLKLQLELLMRECFTRGITHGMDYYE